MAKDKVTESKETSKLNKYEKARILGSRALQISMGAPYLVKLSKKKLAELKYNPLEIAKLELEADVIPISVLREVPKTKTEKKKEEPSEEQE